MTTDPFDDLPEIGEDSRDALPDDRYDGPPEPPAPTGDDPDGTASACAALPLNDFGNGKRFEAHFGADLMFVPRVGWHVWDGTRWKRDDDALETRRLAQRVSGLILDELAWIPVSADQRRALDYLDGLPSQDQHRIRACRTPAAIAAMKGIDPDGAAAAAVLAFLRSARRERASHARTTGNTGKIDSLMTEAAVGLSWPLDNLDTDPLLINCANSTLRLTVVDHGPGPGLGKEARIEQLDHHREHRLTKRTGVAWNAEAKAPTFDAFLREVQPDPDMRGFLQRWLGLSLTGLKHQQICFWYGAGANGKSVLAETVGQIMGDYGATAEIDSLVGENRRTADSATPDLVPLIGARFVRASEPEEGQRLQEARVKKLTGGEPILVRALHKDFIAVAPYFKLTISGNHKPDIRGGDYGIWRRILLVPWEVTIPEERWDIGLVDKLMAEAPGILAWMVEGLMDFLEGGLRPPSSVTEATEDYRQSQDPVGRFLAEVMAVTGQATDVVKTADLVDMFNFWMLENGSSTWKKRTVENDLGKKAGTWRHPVTAVGITRSKASVSQYCGLTMTGAFAERYRDSPRDRNGQSLPEGRGSGF